MNETGTEIVFRADGNSTIGLGHIMRSEVLAAEIAAAGHPVAFLTTREPFVTGYLEQKGFRVYTLPGWSDRSEMFRMTAEAVNKIRPGLVFLDVINTEIEAVESMKRAGVKVVSLDDLGPGSAAVDALIGVDVGILDELLPEQARAAGEGRIYAGADYAIVAPRFTEQISAVAPDKFDRKHIFIGFGGSDPCGSTKPVVEALMKWDYDFEAHIIIGPCMADPVEIIQLTGDGDPRFKTYVDPSDLPEIMAGAAIAICGVGQSLFELNMLGVPALLITQSPLHAKFGENYQRHGSAVHLGRHDVFSPAEMFEWCGRLLGDRELWRRMFDSAMRLIDGRGARRIRDIMETLLRG